MRRPEPGPQTLPIALRAQPALTGDRAVGVLLCHGFTGSTASMRPWADHLARLGYGVAAPRLPGHGTTWQDLNGYRWEDWYGEVARALDSLVREHDAVVVGGLSMGATLALRLAADRVSEVSGVVVVNPAVASGRVDVKLVPLLARVVPSLRGLADDIHREDVSEHGYDRTPLKALASFVGSWGPTLAALPRLTAPLLYFRSATDHVVDDTSQPLITRRVSSTEITEVTLPDSYHVATLDHDAETIFTRSAQFIERVTA